MVPTFELLIHDVRGSWDSDLPPTLQSLREWSDEDVAGRAPFPLDMYEGIGVWLADTNAVYIEERVGNLSDMGVSCLALAARLRSGKAGLLRSSGMSAGWYLLFSSEDPVRVTQVLEYPDIAPFPFHPSPDSTVTASQVDALWAWVKANGPRLLAPTDNIAYDRARGATLRLPRDRLIADVEREAQLAKVVAERHGRRWP